MAMRFRSALAVSGYRRSIYSSLQVFNGICLSKDRYKI